MIKSNKLRYLTSAMIMVVFFTIFSSLGYLLTNTIFKISNRSLSYNNFILTTAMSIVIILTVISTFGVFINYTEAGKKHLKEHNKVLSNTVEALEKIAHGDFNVLIDMDNEHGNYNDVALSVNKMAKELSSMETLRQDFISNVSHEIQSPLTSISGFASLLKNDQLTNKDRLHYLDIIETESKRLSKLSDNLLKLSSLEANVNMLVINEFHLNKQIKNIVLMLEPQWQEKDLNINLDFDDVKINADEDLIFQVWSNLLHNAIKFTPNNGTINLSLKDNKDTIIFKISDSGLGIPKSDQVHIFERFYKVDKSRSRALGGNGLGLSLVKKIIELNHGSIKVESIINQGTTFIIELPK